MSFADYIDWLDGLDQAAVNNILHPPQANQNKSVEPPIVEDYAAIARRAKQINPPDNTPQ